MKRCNLFLLTAVLASGPGSDNVQGQEPLSGDSVLPASLQGVTVTVLRTPIPLVRTPYAVSIVETSSSMPGRPGLALDEALRAVPGVQIDNRYNYALGERISVRGFGARAQFGVRGVRVLVDGVPATFPDGQTSLSHLDLGFLSRAEVIRGPASALYGGSSGGVLQLETFVPAPGERQREAGVIAGAHELFRAQVAVGEGFARGAYSVGLSHQGYGGEREFSEARNLRFHASTRYAFRSGDLRLTAAGVDYDADNPGSLSEPLLAEDRTQAFQNNVNQQTGEEGRQLQLGATFLMSAGPGELGLAAYVISRDILNPIPASVIDLARRVAGLRGVYRTSGRRSTVALGAEAAAQRDDRLNFVNEQGSPGAATLDQEESVDDLALFGQATVRPWESLTLLGGLRYDWYRFSATDRFLEDDSDDSGSIRMAQVSPSVGAALQVSRTLNLYANAATAFETPTTTELANRPDGSGGFNPDLRPQETLSWEVGLKGSSAGSIAYELAMFTADVTDALIPFEVEAMPDRQFFRNAGSARHQGLEVGLRLRPIGWLSGRTAYTYTDARFSDYQVGGEAFDGKRIPGVSPHRVEAILDLVRDGLFLTLEGRYGARTPVDDANSAHSGSYFVADGRAGVRGVTFGEVEVEPVVGVQNLLDREYNSSVVVNAFGRRYFEPAPGRALYGSLRLRF